MPEYLLQFATTAHKQKAVPSRTVIGQWPITFESNLEKMQKLKGFQER
jgi:hypothetical protein